jgi:hypothetical protein
MHVGIYVVTVKINSLLPQTLTTTSSHKGNASKAPITGARRGQNALPRDPDTGAIIRARDDQRNLIYYDI